jgi:hypothetical protein
MAAVSFAKRFDGALHKMLEPANYSKYRESGSAADNRATFKNPGYAGFHPQRIEATSGIRFARAISPRKRPLGLTVRS